MRIMNKNCYNRAKRIAVLSLLTGLGLIAFLLEELIVLPVLPGVKLGFSNFFSLFALLLYGLPSALAVVAVRTLLGALIAGNVSALLYSFIAGMVSAFTARAMLAALKYVSIVCISVLSAVAHDAAQLAVFFALTGTPYILVYAPWLFLLGAGAGAVVGLCLHVTVKAAPRSLCRVPAREGGAA